MKALSRTIQKLWPMYGDKKAEKCNFRFRTFCQWLVPMQVKSCSCMYHNILQRSATDPFFFFIFRVFFPTVYQEPDPLLLPPKPAYKQGSGSCNII